MARDQEFAWTGTLPDKGLVGFVNIKLTAEGVVFSVRSQGNGSGASSSYTVPRDAARVMLNKALHALVTADEPQ